MKFKVLMNKKLKYVQKIFAIFFKILKIHNFKQ